jgi:hypothetical protein
LLFGFSAFSLTFSPSEHFRLMANFDRESYWVDQVNMNSNNVVISADIFTKNVMTLCDANNHEKALKGCSKRVEIVPSSTAYSATDVTQFVPLQKLSASASPVVYRYGIASTATQQKVEFKNYHVFSNAAPAGTLKLEVRLFENINARSLVLGGVYSVKVEVNSQLVYQEEYTHWYNASNANSPNFIAPAQFRAVPSESGKVWVVVTVSFNSSATSQELFLLLGVYLEDVVYDPRSRICLPACAPSTGIDARLLPLLCYSCDTSLGMVYSVLLNRCDCKEGTFLNATANLCQPCGPSCKSCDPLNPSVCSSCLGSVKLLNGTCGCSVGMFLN